MFDVASPLTPYDPVVTTPNDQSSSPVVNINDSITINYVTASNHHYQRIIYCLYLSGWLVIVSWDHQLIIIASVTVVTLYQVPVIKFQISLSLTCRRCEPLMPLRRRQV